MNILQAFGIEETIKQKGFCLALAGSGGKTTTLFNLARQALNYGVKAVWVSTTTHLAVSELQQADLVHYVQNEQDWQNLESSQPRGIVVVCGSEVEENRVAGLPGDGMNRLYRFISDRNEPLFLEVDGSRRRPLKAPADSEPEIPPFTQHVVIVAGLSGLGNPLSDAWVHRPERFAALSGLELGDVITPSALARVMIHPMGGLKHIPQDAQRSVLLNQADSLPTLDVAQEITDQIQQVFPRIIIASLGTDPGHIHAVYQPVAGIILAAGSASRFGAPKQILPWRGVPLVQHVIHTALTAGLYPIKVVIGAYRAQVQAVLETLPEVKSGNVGVIYNPNWNDGLSASIRAGLQELPTISNGAVFLLADQPHIPYQLVRALRSVHAQTRSWAVAPNFRGRRANPVLFSRELFPRLMALQGDTGGRTLLREPAIFPIAWVAWELSNLDFDIDEPSDYQSFLELDKT